MTNRTDRIDMLNDADKPILPSRRVTDTRIGLLILAVVVAMNNSAIADDPSFERDVLPIFTRYCFNCHGKSSPQLGLDLRSARLTMRGSQNGPVVVPGSLEESLLWKKVSTREMPLAIFKLRLSDEEIETIKLWIEAGAPSEKSTELPADVQAQFARFENDIQPILENRCVDCHGTDEPEADLDLTSLASLMRGSKSGPVIVEGFSEKSVLIRKVVKKTMPPPDSGEPLTREEIGKITRWVDKGRFADFVEVKPHGDPSEDFAADPTVSEQERQFWAFQKPLAEHLQNVKSSDRVRTPIDHFVLAKLESNGLTFAPDAPKLTLLRRASFDLTGLPPTPNEARDFLNDDRPDAYERLIDRLLNSPHYGQRWGRHWLDAVGYVDTTGKDFNPVAVSLSDGYWRYRDYVVAATNKDTPWDRFLIEQIAGDELVDWRNANNYSPEIVELLTATGYLRNVLDATNEDISNLPFDRYEALFMLMERVATSTMGMTISCARCHSHKFDPIPQTDYYRFLSLFTAAYNPSDWLQPKNRHLYDVSQTEQKQIERTRNKTNAAVKKLRGALDSIRNPHRDEIRARKLDALPDEVRDDVLAAIETEASQRSVDQNALFTKYEQQIAVTEAEIDSELSVLERAECRKLSGSIKDHENRLASLTVGKIQALWDVGKPPTIRLLHRGDVDFAGPRVTPGFLTVLSPPGKSAAVPSAAAVGETTGLRLAFAEWLTSPEHPLTARVIVNRIWQHHFGRGIVDTPGNFGASGARPTHPELLDWMAIEFMNQGWSAKKLHKLILTSTVYRQSSQPHIAPSANGESGPSPADPQSVDPENRLLWKMELQRLDAEALRDSVLAASGQLNQTMCGPPVMLEATSSGLQTAIDADSGQVNARRSIYLLARKANPLTFLRVFDFPVIDVNCTRRSISATPLQSLTLINSEFLTDSAGRLADRVKSLSGELASTAQRIETAYWLTLSRSPSPSEVAAAKKHLDHLVQLYRESGGRQRDVQQRALENFVHMLLCSNEFLYVD